MAKRAPTNPNPSIPRPQPVQARAIETRSRILARAETAFAELGFDSANLTNDILEPAGVSVGSFYHQFENKREVLFHLLAGRLDEVRSQAESAMLDESHRSFGGSFRAALDVIVSDVEQRPDTWRIRYRERENRDVEIRTAIEVGWTAWSDLALGMLGRWYPTDHPRFRDAAHLTVYMITGTIRDWLHLGEHDRTWGRAEVLEASQRFCEGGIDALLR